MRERAAGPGDGAIAAGGDQAIVRLRDTPAARSSPCSTTRAIRCPAFSINRVISSSVVPSPAVSFQ